jgi:Leucine-rich repeat (LRR) protein
MNIFWVCSSACAKTSVQIVFYFLIVSHSLVAQSVEVRIPDKNLRGAVASALSIDPNLPLFPEDLHKLEKLVARDAEIRNLQGLEHAINLRHLDLRNNDIQSVAWLSGLAQLEWVSIRENFDIENIAAFGNLRELTYVNINRNYRITSILPLKGLRDLEVLIMRDVPVLSRKREQEVLVSLTGLQRLNVRNTGLTDISFLLPGIDAGLYREQLDLRENPIVDAESFAEILTQMDNTDFP